MKINSITPTVFPHFAIGTPQPFAESLVQLFTRVSTNFKKKQLSLVKVIVLVANRVVDLIRAIALKILWDFQSFGIHKEMPFSQSASLCKETEKLQNELALLKIKPLEELQNLHPHAFVTDILRQQTVIDGVTEENIANGGQKIFDLLRPKTSLSDHDLHILRYSLENLLHQGSFMVVPEFLCEMFNKHAPFGIADLANWSVIGELEGQRILQAANKHSSLFELKIVEEKLVISGLRYFRIFEMNNPDCNKGYDACTFEIAIKIADINSEEFLLSKGAVTCKMQSYGFRLSLQHILW